MKLLTIKQILENSPFKEIIYNVPFDNILCFYYKTYAHIKSKSYYIVLKHGGEISVSKEEYEEVLKYYEQESKDE